MWSKSYKSQATHGVAALCKGLGHNPVVFYPWNGRSPERGDRPLCIPLIPGS